MDQAVLPQVDGPVGADQILGGQRLRAGDGASCTETSASLSDVGELQFDGVSRFRSMVTPTTRTLP